MYTFLKKSCAMIAVSVAVPATSVAAQENYPNESLTWIVPFSAGGGADTWTRIIAEQSEEYFGQSFIVQNRPGGGGVVGWDELLSQPADGYTVIHGSPTPVITLIGESDPLFEPSEIKIAGFLGAYETILAAPEGAEWSDWDSLVEYAEANPGELTVAGTNSPMLSVAGIFDQAGIEVTYVPYQGTSDAVSDFLGGFVDVLAATTTSVTPLVSEGVVGVLNASDQQLSELAKQSFGDNVPPVATELGYEAAASPRWVGMHPDTPDKIVDEFSARLGELMADEQVVEMISQTGEEPNFTPAAEAQKRFSALIEQIQTSSELLE